MQFEFLVCLIDEYLWQSESKIRNEKDSDILKRGKNRDTLDEKHIQDEV